MFEIGEEVLEIEKGKGKEALQPPEGEEGRGIAKRQTLKLNKEN